MPRTICGRAWDSFDCYLFDIDGTLLNCTDAVHYHAFCEVLSQVAGRPLDLSGITAHGNTDIGILRDVLERAGIPASKWRERLPELRDRLCAYVESRQHEICATILPGVREVVDHLQVRGALLGVATGNLRRIGERKLRAAGLDGDFLFGGWSDAVEYRADMLRDAAKEAQRRAGEAASILVVGDTPSDIQAAHSNHLPVIAVASGIFSFGELYAETPELCLTSLLELTQEE